MFLTRTCINTNLCGNVIAENQETRQDDLREAIFKIIYVNVLYYIN